MEVCTNENGNCAVASEDLSWALQIGDLDTVKEQLQRLAKENGDWNINNVSNGRTMLHKACDYGHLDIVEYLIQNGADINCKTSDFSLILLKNQKCYIPFTEYLFLTLNGNIKLTTFLFKDFKQLKSEYKNNLMKDNFGITPLLCALWENHFKVAKYLIDKGAITNLLTPQGLKYYECIEDSEMINLLKRLETQ